MLSQINIPSLQVLETQLIEEYKTIGENDGVNGTKNNHIQEFFVASAASFQKIANAELIARINACENRNSELSEKKSMIDREYNQVTKYRDMYTTNSRYLPKLFLGGSIWLYVIIGFGLLVADFAISLQLANKMFELKPSESNIGILMAVGIALVSFFVKFFYDQYIGVSDGISRVRYNEIKELVGENNMWRVNTGIALKAVFNIVILCAVIALYYSMAYTRLAAIVEKESMLNNSEDARNLFLLVNIFIPLVSGICFSLAQKIYTNKKIFSRLDSEVSEVRETQERTQDETRRALEELRRFESLKADWVESSAFIDEYSKIFQLGYENGYTTGYLNPERLFGSTGTLLDRVDRFRNKLFTRKSSGLINLPA